MEEINAPPGQITGGMLTEISLFVSVAVFSQIGEIYQSETLNQTFDLLRKNLKILKSTFWDNELQFSLKSQL